MSAPTLKHYGDPCVHCGIAHDDVPPGPCQGDKSKAVPMAWRGLGVRWDNVEHFLIQYSDGHFEDRWEHTSFHLPYTYLKNARYEHGLQNYSPRPLY